jgi:hypothetical protein
MAAADYTHSPTPEEIMEYVDGEGTSATRAAIEAHLAHCAACQTLASEQRRLSEDVSAWHVDRVPASLRAPAAPRARLLPVRFGAWHRSRFMLAAVGAAALVAISVSLPLRRAKSVQAPATDRGQITQAPPTQASAASASAEAVDSLLSGSSGSLGGQRIAPQRGAQLERPMAQDVTSQGPVGRTAVIRTATLRIVAKDFDGVRQTVEGIVAAAGGFVDQMTATGDAGSARALRGTLRIPSDRLGEVAERLRRLGQVVEDTQGSEDVADQLVDLDARLASARATERRLTELLRNRTGKLSDVLDVERELARVRLDIERLDAEAANIGRRVSYATLTIEIVEERKAGFDPGPLSLASRFRIAAADGLESALESVAWTLLFLLRAGPFLLLWTVVLGSAWLGLRRALGSRMGDSH